MKISKALLGAVILILAVAVFSCKEDEGLGLPGAKKVSELKQNFDGTTVTEDEAKVLLSYALSTNFKNKLRSAYNAAYDTAFKAAYGMSSSAYYTSKSAEKSYSTSVKIKDSDELKKAVNVAIATLEGSSSYKVSSNLPLAAAYVAISTGTGANGDYYQVSESGNLTFSITDGFYESDPTNYYGQFTNNTYSSSDRIKYKIAGFVTVKDSESTKYTVKDVAKKIYEQSQSGEQAVSVSLTISCEVIPGSGSTTTAVKKGGKFILSCASEGSSKSRFAEESYSSICSDIEVYNNEGTLVHTFRGDDAEDYLDFRF